MQNKVNLRNTLLAARNALAPEIRTHNDFAIGRQVINWLIAHPVRTLGVYWPIRNEPDLHSIYPDITARGVQLALPVVVAKEAPLQFLAWAPGDALANDRMGIPIPVPSSVEVQPDAVLVPCVGFNAALIRLGYGKGFYDRTLARSPRPITVGIAYAFSEVVFDGAPHDVALDVMITESAILSAE
ncbi:MAG: 5-formyltetrahydrofolate cyclo-ligase [Burkholderiaceae bacterium]